MSHYDTNWVPVETKWSEVEILLLVCLGYKKSPIPSCSAKPRYRFCFSIKHLLREFFNLIKVSRSNIKFCLGHSCSDYFRFTQTPYYPILTYGADATMSTHSDSLLTFITETHCPNLNNLFLVKTWGPTRFAIRTRSKRQFKVFMPNLTISHCRLQYITQL